MRRLIIAAMFATIVAGPALAECKKLGFSVNDYGKDGPTNDAKKLLDGYIVQWARENGVAKYRTGKKDVSCELFIDVGFFDEHTCKATATVCWNKADKQDGPLKSDGSSTAKSKAKSSSKPKANADAKSKGPAKKATPPKA